MELTLHQNQNLGTPTVNGRELQEALELTKTHTTWAQQQIERGAFEENVDYVVSPQLGRNSEGGRPLMTYHFTLHAAKHIAMMSRSRKGKEARDYFIECEKRLLAGEPKVKTLTDMDRTVAAVKAAVDVLMMFPGVKQDVLGVHSLKLLQNASGVDLQDFRLALPNRLTSDVPMNATDLAKEAGLKSARLMNLRLAECGLQWKDGDKWVPTPAGEKYCDQIPYQNPENGHAGWQLMWRKSVLAELA